MAIMEPIKSLKPGTKAKRTFALDRSSINQDTRTIDLSFSSETPYERWWGIEILDHGKKSIRLDRLTSGGPLLVDHDTRDIVGVIESVSIDTSLTGRAEVRFGKSARAEEVYQDVLDGIRRGVSVGYVIHDAKLVETKDGVDTWQITDWEPLEISLVSVPADPTVGVGRAMDEESPIITKSPIPKEQRMSEVTLTAADIAAAETRARDEALKSEQKRTNEILIIGQEYGAMDLASKAVRDGIGLQEFQRQVLEARKTGTITFGQAARTKDNLADDKKLGFRNLGHFCADVVQACRTGGKISETLTRAASVYANEGSGPDGGYDVPPEFAQGISSLALSEESLLSRAQNIPVEGNSMSFTDSEATPWGSSGVIATWDGEGSQGTPTKPSTKKKRLELNKLRVLVAATDELLGDSSAMSSHLTQTMRDAVNWKVQDAIVNGSGAGVPLGLTKGPAIVTQTKESGQAADTIVAANIAKMYARGLGGAGASFVWLINPDAFPQIITLTLNNNPIFMANNQGIKNAPDGFLMGRPIILTDTCQTLGNLYDIVYANMNGYRVITKSAGAQFSTSMHLWFDQDIQAFKLVVRMDGQPQLSAPVTPPNSSVTRSHFVTLEAR
jgi:HK97 family phage major capsid protein/HK97 family phage prohead protease